MPLQVTPEVSVIIPNYNHAAFLEQRITSVLNQTFQNFEVIILDDCSTDNSREVIEQFRSHPKVKEIVYNTTNSGSPFKQWKKGIERASGKLIWIAESDDWCELDFLSTLVGLFDVYPDTSMAYCKSLRVNEQGEYLDDLAFWYDDLSAGRWNNNYYNTGLQEIKNYLCFKNTIPNASAVVFKKAEARVSTSFTNYKLSGDWLYWINLLEKGGNIAYTIQTINYFRTHPNSVRNHEEKNNTLQKERDKIIRYLLTQRHITRRKAKHILGYPHPIKYLFSALRKEINRVKLWP